VLDRVNGLMEATMDTATKIIIAVGMFGLIAVAFAML
jgi:hypothetical protein